MRRLSPILLTLAALLAAPVLLQWILRAQTGPLPFAATFEVQALTAAGLAAMLAIPGALGSGRARAAMRLVALGVLVLTAVPLGGELWSPGPERAATRSAAAPVELRVLSWNLEDGSKSPAESVAGLREVDADVVALQELDPGAAAAIEADPALRTRYPYRILAPGPNTTGMGLLATRPLLAGDASTKPLILRAGLLLDDGLVVEVLDVHPYPPGYRLAWGVLPVSLDTRRRDEDLARIARMVAGLDDPAAALVVGDLNTASTEPGFDVLTERLVDAHTAVGEGPGFTWRPGPLEGEGLGFLRIDHVLAGARLTPIASGVDCTAKGDHCRLTVTLRVEPAALGA